MWPLTLCMTSLFWCLELFTRYISLESRVFENEVLNLVSHSAVFLYESKDAQNIFYISLNDAWMFTEIVSKCNNLLSQNDRNVFIVFLGNSKGLIRNLIFWNRQKTRKNENYRPNHTRVPKITIKRVKKSELKICV